MGVSENRGTSKSSILIGIPIINHPFWGTTIFGNIQICILYMQIPSIQKVAMSHSVILSLPWKPRSTYFRTAMWLLLGLGEGGFEGDKMCVGGGRSTLAMADLLWYRSSFFFGGRFLGFCLAMANKKGLMGATHLKIILFFLFLQFYIFCFSICFKLFFVSEMLYRIP